MVLHLYYTQGMLLLGIPVLMYIIQNKCSDIKFHVQIQRFLGMHDMVSYHNFVFLK